MAIPLKYNLRNLAVRRTTTVMTAFSVTLTIMVGVLLRGFRFATAAAAGIYSALLASLQASPLKFDKAGRDVRCCHAAPRLRTLRAS